MAQGDVVSIEAGGGATGGATGNGGVPPAAIPGKRGETPEVAPPQPLAPLQHLAPRTEQWAKLVLPAAWFVLFLTGMVFLVPFFVIAAADLDTADKVTHTINWGTHVLAVVVGFASAVLGYFFGVSTTEKAS